MNRDAEILKLKEEGKTLEEIGKQFGLTKERVRQICVKQGMRYTRTHAKDVKLEKVLKKPSTYPSNVVCVNEDGGMVWISDGKTNWVEIHNKRLKAAIAEIFNLQSWITI